VADPACPLHESRDPRDFLSRLERCSGRSLDDLLDPIVPAEGREAVLLAGSIPLGIATELSDVDLVVVARGLARDLSNGRASADVTSLYSADYSSGGSDAVLANHVLKAGNAEIDVLVLLASGLDALIARVAGSRVALSAHHLELLGRLKYGWVLSNGEERPALTGLRRDNALELHCGTRAFVTAVKALRHSGRALPGEPLLAAHLSRHAVEKGFEAYLSSRGYVALGLKWLRFVRRRTAVDPELAEVARLGLPLLFPDPDDAAAHLERARGFLAQVRERIERDLAFRLAFRMCPQIEIQPSGEREENAQRPG
jgi:hypothetical protein